MLETPHEATLVVIDQAVKEQPVLAGWMMKDLDFLLRDIRELVKRKTVGSSIMYVLLLFLAMVAIFDTQILSVFRRKKEMGTLMALGMAQRSQVVYEMLSLMVARLKRFPKHLFPR